MKHKIFDFIDRKTKKFIRSECTRHGRRWLEADQFFPIGKACKECITDQTLIRKVKKI